MPRSTSSDDGASVPLNSGSITKVWQAVPNATAHASSAASFAASDASSPATSVTSKNALRTTEADAPCPARHCASSIAASTTVSSL